MKCNTISASVAVTLALLLSCGLLLDSRNGRGLVPGVQANDGAAAAPQIEGTWLLTVTPPPESGRAPFKVLISFARGGVFLASAEASALGLPAQNGTWAKAGSNEFVATSISFGTGATPDDVVTFKVKSLFRVVSDDELEGIGELAVCDASGINCKSFPGCSTLRAMRVRNEPPACPESTQ